MRLRPRLRLSLALGLPRGGRCCWRPARASADAPTSGSRSPAPRVAGLPLERTGPPRLLGCPLTACRASKPRRMCRPLAQLPRDQHRCLQVTWNPGHPGCDSFRGQLRTAHCLACPRIAGVVTSTVARLASGAGGLTLRRAGITPAGQLTKFHGFIASSNPPRPAEPGRTMRAIRREVDPGNRIHHAPQQRVRISTAASDCP